MTLSSKSPDSPTCGHKRGHSVHSTLESLECIHALRSQSNEFSPLVPRHHCDALTSSSSKDEPRGRSSSFPLSPKYVHDAPMHDDDEAIAGMDMVVKDETKKGDSECDGVIY